MRLSFDPGLRGNEALVVGTRGNGGAEREPFDVVQHLTERRSGRFLPAVLDLLFVLGSDFVTLFFFASFFILFFFHVSGLHADVALNHAQRPQGGRARSGGGLGTLPSFET